jgi:7-cyano-7-deazaguanine synthase
MEKAIVLLSGGLDSATCLAIARSRGFECYTLAFDYGQRHRCELERAALISRTLGAAKHAVMPIDLRQWGGSALTDDAIDVPAANDAGVMPVTYVPARNLIFLSFAAAWGEILKARHIFIGVNSVDYSGYPDCRKAFIDSFKETAELGTCARDENWQWHIETPLQAMSKSEIIRTGTALGVDYGMTVSCYDPDADGRACGVCDSCALRKAGFAGAGVPDPTRYQER